MSASLPTKLYVAIYPIKRDDFYIDDQLNEWSELVRCTQSDSIPEKVLAIDTVAGTAVDVTKNLAIAVADRIRNEGDAPEDDMAQWFDEHGIDYSDDDRSQRAEHGLYYRGGVL